MSWKKVTNLFWQSSNDGSSASGSATSDADGEVMSDDDFAAFLAADANFLPPDELPATEVADPAAAALSSAALPPRKLDGDGDIAAAEIDFQAEYDRAEIPDTDEVEQLENFLQRLDPQLPRDSKLAAAEAFLGAIGKDPSAVLDDASRKIHAVRALGRAHSSRAEADITSESAAIAELEAQIELHRERIQDTQAALECVTKACALEESRLQAARVFFGHAHELESLAAADSQ